MKNLTNFLLGAVLTVSLSPISGMADSVTVFSGSGFVLPETITLIPSGFGSLGGNYFVPDPNFNNFQGELFVLPSGGGAPIPFASPPNGNSLLEGAFVPSGYGAL